MFASGRTVLMISEESLYIYASGARSTRLVDVVPWDDVVFVDKVASICSKDCGGKPLLIVNDMVEQHYRKERIPRVGLLDKAAVVKRKLRVAFPNYPVRAALPLKEKIQAKSDNAKGSIYIFAAVPSSDPFEKTMAAAKQSLCTIAGFGLLPVESSDLLKKLSARLTPRGKKKPVWTLLVGQHRHGGLRQIVTKNGELALTRMTPVTDDEEDPQEWAKDVHQEFKATMSYLARFGFTAEDGLDVIAVAGNEAGEMLGELIDVDCNYHPLTVREAAKNAGITIGPQDSPRYADPLHVCWISKKSKLILPMRAQAIDEVSKPRQIAMVATFLLLVGAAVQGYMVLDQFQAMQTVADELQTNQIKYGRLKSEYEAEVAKKEALGFDVRLVQAAVDVHTRLKEEDLRSLNLMDAIGRALGRDLRIDEIKLEKNEVQHVAVPTFGSRLANFAQLGARAPYEINFLMTFPSTTDIDRGNREVSDLRDRLAKMLPEHTVSVEKFLRDYEYVDELVVETGNAGRNDVGQDFTAAIKILGPEEEPQT